MKTVLITGSSRGIGAETARCFAQHGWKVAVNYRSSKEAALRLAEEIGGKAFCADVSSEEQAVRLIDQVTKEFGQIDVLVNNAGIAQQKLFTDLTAKEWKDMFAVDVDGVFYCSKAVLPQMIRRKCGKIINLSSIWGLTGASCEVHYSAAKAAVIGLTKALAKEVGPSGIQVNCVAPGVILTDMNLSMLTPSDLDQLKEEIPLERLGRPQEIAKTILFLAEESGDYLTGQVLSPNGGMVI